MQTNSAEALEAAKSTDVVYEYYRRLMPADDVKLRLGIELEFPIVRFGGAMIDLQVVEQAVAFIAGELGFSDVTVDDSGIPAKMVHPETADTISFDQCYAILEFSLGHASSIGEIEERFLKSFFRIQDFLLARDHLLISFGTNPYSWVRDIPLVKVAYYQAQRAFVAERQRGGPGACRHFLSLIASTHLHLSMGEPRIIEAMNVLNRIEWVKGALFANSCVIDGELDPRQNLARRDGLWQESGLTSADYDHPVSDASFNDLRDYCASLLPSLQGYHVMRDSGLVALGAQRLDRYVEHIRRGERLLAVAEAGEGATEISPCAEDLRYFRSFAYNALSPKYGTLELRSACGQPLDSLFAPSAFSLGVVSNLAGIERLLVGIPGTNSALRRRATSYEFWDTEEQFAGLPLKEFLVEVCDQARAGLVRRGFGEERYLDGLYQRVERGGSPGRMVVDSLRGGTPLDRIVESVSNIPRRNHVAR